MNRNAVICPPCGENVAVATKRGAYKAFSLISPSIGPADHFLRKGGRKGFTLIELLVVVLIIGILAAVALPQYQIAVKKSQLAKLMPLVHSIVQAERVAFLANGSYEKYFLSNLDITLPGCEENSSGGIVLCGDFAIDVYTALGIGSDVTGFVLDNGEGGTLAYAHKLDTDEKFCIASQSDELSQQVCKNLGGTYRSKIDLSGGYSDRIKGPVYVYQLNKLPKQREHNAF